MKIALIHTSNVLVPMFSDLCRELLPAVEVNHFADDSLIKETIAHGSPTAAVADRLHGYINQAQSAGADLIMVTCSSVGDLVDAASKSCTVPLCRVDRAMVEQAISLGTRVGVLATVSTTLRPTAELVKQCAALANKSIDVQEVLCDGALEKLLAGNKSEHDEMVKEKLLSLLPLVDVVILAQASMARVVEQIPAESTTVPIFSSPRLAIESVAKLLRSNQAAAT